MAAFRVVEVLNAVDGVALAPCKDSSFYESALTRVAERASRRPPCRSTLNETAYAVLQRQRGRHPERVFTFKGKPLNSANTRAWKQALLRAGISDFRWHDLRHTWATWQRQAGTPTHELQRLGGWRTGVMVERYAHLAPDHLALAASRLDSVLAGYDSATAA